MGTPSTSFKGNYRLKIDNLLVDRLLFWSTSRTRHNEQSKAMRHASRITMSHVTWSTTKKKNFFLFNKKKKKKKRNLEISPLVFHVCM